jgi:hypothetical protein
MQVSGICPIYPNRPDSRDKEIKRSFFPLVYLFPKREVKQNPGLFISYNGIYRKEMSWQWK